MWAQLPRYTLNFPPTMLMISVTATWRDSSPLSRKASICVEQRITLDLHGMNKLLLLRIVPFVACILQQEVLTS
jgi:hypothetical protein